MQWLYSGDPVKHEEDQQQALVVVWARTVQRFCPDLALLYHPANGGKRGLLEAVRLKQAGVLAGIPDLHLPIARHGFHGLWIEMKSATGVVSKSQKNIVADLRAAGHSVHICRSSNEAIEVIKKYLDIRLT